MPAGNGATDARPLDSGSSASSGPTLVGWPRSIAWSEFDEVSARPAGEKEDAQIASEVEQPQQVAVARAQGQFRVASYEARLVVHKDLSWVVKSTKSVELLAHEQGHYDITGLGGRDMIADIGRARASSRSDLANDVKAIIKRAQEVADKLTKTYDTDTDHSRKRDRQQKWEQLIASCMQNGTRLTGGPP